MSSFDVTLEDKRLSPEIRWRPHTHTTAVAPIISCLLILFEIVAKDVELFYVKQYIDL